jgi:hypothetical protein
MNGLAMRKRAMQSVMEGNTLQRARLGILRSTIGRTSEEVTFSPGEKLILLMLADLHDHLKIKSETGHQATPRGDPLRQRMGSGLEYAGGVSRRRDAAPRRRRNNPRPGNVGQTRAVL